MSQEQQVQTFVDIIRSYCIENIVPILLELQRLLPDSLLFGSFVLYILTHLSSYGFFSLFLIESKILHSLLAYVFQMIYGPSTPSSIDISCVAGLLTPRLEWTAMKPSSSYPSSSPYYISAVATYIGMSMRSFQTVLQTMGSEWESRTIVSLFFIIAMTIVLLTTRYLQGCESISSILFASSIGIVVGLLFYALHTRLFGQESVNFLGLPLIVSSTNDGNPIYICAETKVR